MGNEAIREMITDILKTEEMMEELYRKIIGRIDDRNVIRILDWIAKDERKHADNARKMMAILDG